ncbi:MAG: hypothetical protein A2X23_01440 [Chloroflexi bacterium GWC2_73_18]|nr:MAG: hypothetical protein A2X23_01440 [Chloroflexi bacterium GWC2_73_18]
MGATGLAADPQEYRRRLAEQDDEQIDAWAEEMMRDLSVRAGVRRVVSGFLGAARLDERSFERVFAAGGGAIATLGRTGRAELMVPAVALHHLVAGIRRETPDGRARLIDYLVDNFHEIVFV